MRGVGRDGTLGPGGQGRLLMAFHLCRARAYMSFTFKNPSYLLLRKRKKNFCSIKAQWQAWWGEQKQSLSWSQGILTVHSKLLLQSKLSVTTDKLRYLWLLEIDQFLALFIYFKNEVKLLTSGNIFLPQKQWNPNIEKKLVSCDLIWLFCSSFKTR